MAIDPTTESEAATTIQRFWRGHKARQQYGINQLPTAQLTQYEAFMVGNSPCVDLAPYTITDKRIALVGNSALRSLQMILALSQGGPVPKLIIVENSRKVITMWRQLREMCESLPSSIDPKSFEESFNQFLQCHQALYINLDRDIMDEYGAPGVTYYPQDPVEFMRLLISQHSIERVLQTIRQATFLQQSWTDKQLFPKLKNILTLNSIDHVIGFPSNVAGLIARKHKGASKEAEQVFLNLEALHPSLSIISNLSKKYKLPSKITVSTATTARGIQDESDWDEQCEAYRKKSICHVM